MTENTLNHVVRVSDNASNAFTTAEELYKLGEYNKAHGVLSLVLKKSKISDHNMLDHIKFLALIATNNVICRGFDTCFAEKYQTDSDKLDAMKENNSLAIAIVEPLISDLSPSLRAQMRCFLDDLLEIEKCLQYATEKLKSDGNLNVESKKEFLKTWGDYSASLFPIPLKLEESTGPESTKSSKSDAKRPSSHSFARIKKIFNL